MNWLAHVYLSRDNINFKLGNLLTDVSRPEHLEVDEADFQAGVQCHYEIDRFTDSHELVKKCKKVFFPNYRHFSAVLVDIFFDHFLARNWAGYCSVPYRDYVNEFYLDLKNHSLELHPLSREFIESIYTYDRLGVYDKISGMEGALERISKRIRMRTKIDIRDSIKELKDNYESLENDFMIFFPELEKHIQDCDSLKVS